MMEDWSTDTTQFNLVNQWVLLGELLAGIWARSYLQEQNELKTAVSSIAHPSMDDSLPEKKKTEMWNVLHSLQAA